MRRFSVLLAALAIALSGVFFSAAPAEAAPRCTYRVNNGALAPYADGVCTGVRKHRTVVVCWPGFIQKGSFVASGKTSRANCPWTNVTNRWSDYLYDL